MFIRVRSWHASIDCFDCYNILGNAFALIHTEGVARTVKTSYLWCAIQRNGTLLASKMNQWGIKCFTFTNNLFVSFKRTDTIITSEYLSFEHDRFQVTTCSPLETCLCCFIHGHETNYQCNRVLKCDVMLPWR